MYLKFVNNAHNLAENKTSRLVCTAQLCWYKSMGFIRMGQREVFLLVGRVWVAGQRASELHTTHTATATMACHCIVWHRVVLCCTLRLFACATRVRRPA